MTTARSELAEAPMGLAGPPAPSVPVKYLWLLHELLSEAPQLAEDRRQLLALLPAGMQRDSRRIFSAFARLSALARLLEDPESLPGWRTPGADDDTVQVVSDVFEVAAVCPLSIGEDEPLFDPIVFRDLLLEAVPPQGHA
jgi:hypothetical protein